VPFYFPGGALPFKKKSCSDVIMMMMMMIKQITIFLHDLMGNLPSFTLSLKFMTKCAIYTNHYINMGTTMLAKSKKMW
jgi:hypothetical protein